MNRVSRRQFLSAGAAGLVGAGLAGRSAAVIGDAAAATDMFTFAVISDTHILDAPSVAIVNEAVALINGDARIQFTCVPGDVVTDGKEAELALAKDAFDKLAQPYYVVPGNHDVYSPDEDIYANHVTAFGPVHWIHEQHGWTFIGLNSCEGTKSDVAVDAAEMEWLHAQLERLDPERPLAMFCHHPMNPNTKAYRILNADDLLALFAGHNLKLIAAGHWHGNQIEEEDGVLFVTTACCASTRNNFDNTPEKGYRLFHLKGDTVETEFVVVRA